jgi:hypothetical protein
MTRKTDSSRTATSSEREKPLPIPRPVDVHDGIPDRVQTPSRKRLWLVLGLFIAWIGVLAYFLLAARP